jgi:hypothetical protein
VTHPAVKGAEPLEQLSKAGSPYIFSLDSQLTIPFPTKYGQAAGFYGSPGACLNADCPQTVGPAFQRLVQAVQMIFKVSEFRLLNSQLFLTFRQFG